MSSVPEEKDLIDRREAIRRVSALLGGVALIGGSSLLVSCTKDREPAAAAGAGTFTTDDIAFLDEVADTILPDTKTPGAKAAKVGAFMAVMVTDTYDADDQKIFREGMRKLDDASQQMNKVPFMKATPAQRLALLEALDREQKEYNDAREAANKAKAASDSTVAAAKGGTAGDQGAESKKADAVLPDQRQENALNADVGSAPAITADSPNHYFRMMKELTLLGYFTSEIGYTKAQRYVESPGRYDPCLPYQPGETAWAPHA
jgi:hypothetical protein